MVLFAADAATATHIAAVAHNGQILTVTVVINDAAVVVIVLPVAFVVLAEPYRAKPLASRCRGYVPGRDSDATVLRAR